MTLLRLHISLLSPIREAQAPAAPLLLGPRVQAPVYVSSPGDAASRLLLWGDPAPPGRRNPLVPLFWDVLLWL